MRVYLAGPVDPALLEYCLGWRREIATLLTDQGITALDPCRGGQHPKPDPSGVISGMPVSPRQLVTRDKADIRSANLVLVHWPAESEKFGIGTIMEIALAREWQIPVLVVDPGNRISDHPWVVVHTSERHDTLASAVAAIVGYWMS